MSRQSLPKSPITQERGVLSRGVKRSRILCLGNDASGPATTDCDNRLATRAGGSSDWWTIGMLAQRMGIRGRLGRQMEN